ncbi:MAG: serine/threonine protein kinase [Actinobacteria bacterium]|nr:serine/threonine protein kinase [Actinomycetota bacterium]
MSWRLGPYRVDDRPFASGATAEVFAARRGRGGLRVAIKVLPLRTYRERAEAEADTASIDHPRLLTVRDSVVDERRGVVGLVMDLADEGDLRSALRGGEAPTPIEMLQIADDVLAALEVLHAAGLVHRDIKPENVMLERVDGAFRGRLGDLGIARPVDRTRSTGSVLGTDLYIAPEVHDGGAPSASADLWALGYVLYEGLFGAPPHADAATTYQAIGRLRADGPNRPPQVPDAIWRVVAALLAPQPADRPASAQAARALLASARPAAEVASAVTARPESLRPASRRRSSIRRGGFPRRPVYERAPGITRAAAGAAAVVLVVAGLAWLGGGERLQWFNGTTDAIGAVSSIAPLSPESDSVVPTQYQWTLRHGVLIGRLSVTNPTAVATAATAVPELFPSSASVKGDLALVGFNGATERQSDGSVLVRFAVPPLAPRAHHVVSFRLALGNKSGDRATLDKLVENRQAAINRHVFALSDAPTLDHFVASLTSDALEVGQQAHVTIQGYTRDGKAAPTDLVRDVRVEVVSGANVAHIEGVAVTALAPGHAVLRAVIGDLRSDVSMSVATPPTAATAPPVTTKKKSPTTRQRPPTTATTTVQEPSPTTPDEDSVVV